VSRHRATGGSALLTLLIAGPLLTLGVAFVGLNVVLAQSADFHPSWVATWPFAAAFVLVGVFFALRWWRARSSALDLRRRGLVYREGRQTWRLRWREIEGLRYGAVARGTGAEHHLKLDLRSGEQLSVHPWLGDLGAAAVMIQSEVGKRAIRHARRQLKADEPALFGELTLSGDALWVGTQKLPWTEVGEVAVHAGTLHVSDRRGETSCTLAAHEVPNLPVLLALVQERLPRPNQELKAMFERLWSAFGETRP